MARYSGGVLALLFIVIATLDDAKATLVDWSTQSWTPGSLSNSFDVDPGNPGNDVTVTVSGDTGQLQPGLASPNPQTPAITSALTGGFIPAHPNLELALNLANNAQVVTVTIDFSNLYAAGVSNVSFNIFDIDYSNSSGNTFQDVIRSISATSTDGTLIDATITGVGPNVSLTGAGLNQELTGIVSTSDVTGDANATISFNTTNIRSVTFTYGTSGLFADPTYEHIGIDNIDFTVVPEFNPTWVTLGMCGALVLGTSLRRRSKKRRAETHQD